MLKEALLHVFNLLCSLSVQKCIKNYINILIQQWVNIDYIQPDKPTHCGFIIPIVRLRNFNFKRILILTLILTNYHAQSWDL